jgi:hypothetical protein
LKQLLIIFLLFPWSIGCRNKPAKVIEPINETKEVIKLALGTAFYHGNLPEISSLYRGKLFNDSILLQIDSFPVRLLPTDLLGLKFKIFNANQIARLKQSYQPWELPNYLFICCLERTDTSYSIYLQRMLHQNTGSI